VIAAGKPNSSGTYQIAMVDYLIKKLSCTILLWHWMQTVMVKKFLMCLLNA